MGRVELSKARSLKGEITPPPDKSITHRAIMFACLAEGKSMIANPLMAGDPISTMNAFKRLGVEIKDARGKGQGSMDEIIIHGKGLYGLKEPFDVINCGNSGTTARLISGILAGNPFFSVLTGDDSLKQRPMARVINPLSQMGAIIYARSDNKYLPMSIKGGSLKAINYNMPVASAQVKSCLILAGLYAEGTTTITEPQRSRDHTERILKSMGAEIEIRTDTPKRGPQKISDFLGCQCRRLFGDPDPCAYSVNREKKIIYSDNRYGQGTRFTEIKVRGPRSKKLKPIDIIIPSDFSSAAFFIVGALVVPDSELIIRDVCVNPTRTGLLDVIKEMGAQVRIENQRNVSGEPVADIYCRTADSLKAVSIGKEHLPSMIDEFPILCILATQAEGVTEIRGAEELRIKESDRIKAMATELRKMGVELEEYPDGIAIKGKTGLKGATVNSYGDHRIAMSFSIAALIADRVTTINNPECVDISFPGFFEELKRLSNRQ